MYLEDNAERPKRLSMGYMKHCLYDYVDAPPRCYNCQRYGHTAKFCRRTTPVCSSWGAQMERVSGGRHTKVRKLREGPHFPRPQL